jgi:hypothetical protein
MRLPFPGLKWDLDQVIHMNKLQRIATCNNLLVVRHVHM